MPSYDFHGGIVDILHRRHVYVEKPWVPQEEEMYAASFYFATFNGEVLQVPALPFRHPCTKAKPLISELNAAPQIEVLDEAASP